MLDTILISGFVGFLLGGIVMAIGVYKTFCEAWDTAWNDGYQYGTETMLIKNTTERKGENGDNGQGQFLDKR